MRITHFKLYAITTLKIGVATITALCLVGCKTANFNKYFVSDTESNRKKIDQLLAATAKDHSFQDDSARFESLHLVAAYIFRGEHPRRTLTLIASVSDGKIQTSLCQVKTWKRRTKEYLLLKAELENKFKTSFGDDVKTSEFDEGLPFF